MFLWKKASNSLCKVCLNTQTLQHLVSGCKIHLNEKRYTWRHDSILTTIATYLKNTHGNFIYYADIHGFDSPSVIAGEEQRPDIIIPDTNKLYVIELTVGFETRISINAERKLKHYENLCKELRNTFQSVTHINLSMGALGLVGKKQ